jgi:uncharacterized membrane protein
MTSDVLLPVKPPTSPIGWDAPWRWLRLGWNDLVRNPVPGLTHGVLIAAFGAALLLVAYDRFWLLAGAFSGFMLVAPILTTGLYQVSKLAGSGISIGLRDVVRIWFTPDGRLIVFGLLLGLAATGWVVTSASMVTSFANVPVRKPMDFLVHVVLAPEGWLFEAWLLLGGVLAAPVFASSVVAIPLLVDTKASVREAVFASWSAVGAHPVVLGVWALVIMTLVGVGMLTALLGLVVAVPWLAHASWHAYRELAPRTRPTGP